MKLGDICEIKSRIGRTIKNNICTESEKSGIPVYVINVGDIISHKEIDFDKKDIIKDLSYNIVNNRLLEPGDLIITPRNNNFKTLIWKKEYPKSIYDINLNVIRIKDNLYSPIILSYILKFKQNKIFTKDIKNKNYIKKTTLMNLEIPEFTEQERMKIEMKLLALEKKSIKTICEASSKCRLYKERMYDCIFK